MLLVLVRGRHEVVQPKEVALAKNPRRVVHHLPEPDQRQHHQGENERGLRGLQDPQQDQGEDLNEIYLVENLLVSKLISLPE